jgi:hypothetical protein
MSIKSIFDLYNYHYIQKNVIVTKAMMINWVGSYFAHYVLQGNNPISEEFHKDVCKREHAFDHLTSKVPFLEPIISKSLGCTLFSWQPFEIYAQTTNQTREEAGKEIWNHKLKGEPLKYIDIIETHFKEYYGIDKTEFKALSGILALTHIYHLTTETKCIEIAEKIIQDNFIFKPTGISGPD